MNYRLGALGFLDGVGGKGNYGIMDQRLALEWIQQHIHNFGGDSKRVTLVGQSAGAMAVLVHLVSPKTRVGLFNKVILMVNSNFLTFFIPKGISICNSL